MALKGLTGKVAVVTGAGQGIGAATAQRLLDEGCKVVALDIKEAGLTQYANNPSAVTVVTDITKESDCMRAIANGIEKFGAIHLLANCAGIMDAVGTIADMDIEAFERVMAVNVRGTMLTMRACLRPMIAQKQGGAIVNIASIAAVRGSGLRSAYGASKRAVVGLTVSAAIENGQHGIRVNAVGPGLIDTPMFDGLEKTGRTQLQTALATRPISRMGKPEEMAAVIAWLLSDEASYVTGSLHLADGGFTLI